MVLVGLTCLLSILCELKKTMAAIQIIPKRFHYVKLADFPYSQEVFFAVMKHKYRKYLQKYFDFVIEISQNAICYHEKKTTNKSNPIHKPLRHPVRQSVCQWNSGLVKLCFLVSSTAVICWSQNQPRMRTSFAVPKSSRITPPTLKHHMKKRNTMVVHSLALLRTTLFAKPQ